MSGAYIDRINVYGFKSYGNRRLSIPVGNGFVGIVGPNGSGKSNIGDAIVFALGLATAKSMRALKLSDLIFSSRGKSAEYAEVEVIFKNEGAFPLNDEEVSIYRKVEHNGKSTYKINGRPAKQYEVEELLSYAGIPKQGYNIVTQGDIFKFIKMTPSERRDLLSEIAGITEYEERKEKALKDLEETEEKISSAKLILKEVKSNLKRLEEERENALLASQLEEKIKEIQEKIKGVKLYFLLTEQEKALKELEQVENRINQLYLDKEKSIEKQKEKISQIKELENKLNELQESLLPVKEKEGAITSQIRHLNEKKSEIEEQLQELQELLKELAKEKEEKVKEVIQLEEEIKNLKRKLPEIKRELEEAEKELEEKNKKLKEIEIGGSKAKLDLGQIEKEEKELKEKQGYLHKEKLHLEMELTRLQEKIESYRQEIEQLTEELEGLRKSKGNIKSFVESQERKIKGLQSELQRLKIRKETLTKKLKENREKIEQNFQRLAQILAQLSQIREDKVMTLIRDVKGVYGQVADLIGVKDPELTTAIEAAAGGRLKNIVVEDDRVAEECIRILKQNKAGKATFIPLNRIKVQQATKPPLMRGVIGLAADFVEYSKDIEKAIKYVFGETVIVENFDAARTLGIGTFRMVTLEGDIFEKSGTITGGADKHKGASLGRGTLEQEKIRLEKEDDRLKKEEEMMEEELKKIDQKIALTEKELYQLQTESQNVLERNREIEEKIQQNVSRINILEEEIMNLKKKQLEIENKLDVANRHLAEVERQIQAVEERKKEILEKMESEGLHKLRKEWEEATQKVYSLREKKNELENQIEKLTDRLENSLKVRIFQIENEKLKTEDSIKLKQKQIEEIKSQIEQLSNELSNLWKGLKEKEKERDTLLEKIETLKEELKILRYEEENINKEITYLLEDKGKYEQKVEDLKEELMLLKEEYDGEPIEGDLKQLEKELREYQEKRQQIGAVNQKALEDYEEIKERYEDLSQKLKVLIDEKKSIEELIENLEQKKIQAFMEVYEAVNKNLGKIFKRLSPGGKAYLEIENEEDPLSGGILLKARPRGKDVKRLEIMSGGEKTLTALAFLFAVQQYRPAPFYYFDEVDAHLDDANARKIAELMKELSQEAQFIVVTLRDTMASYADRLLGVSAREGISNVYSLELAEVL
ncbi:chromosome segregation protein SMC [Persephonella sp. KM09-Lau-8]|uniref:chromosome segregation protein SMC n=1 Tax=Persephonella sp. KM09-Lau-8 TaxID=1158345 RepID=UPI000495A36E|nr:chromosome segregation protein SMC [Persephonella sp. KM09-Lau-8]